MGAAHCREMTATYLSGTPWPDCALKTRAVEYGYWLRKPNDADPDKLLVSTVNWEIRLLLSNTLLFAALYVGSHEVVSARP